MTGYPKYNFEAFESATAMWRAKGYKVTSPHEITADVWQEKYGLPFNPETDKLDWGDELMNQLLSLDLQGVCEADAILLLPGWEKSKGVAIELAVARALHHVVLDAHTGLPIKDGTDKDHQAPKETVLQEAQRLVYGDRQSSYGHPYDDYSRTAKMWEAILGLPTGRISPQTACLMMAAVKISRQVNAPKRDNMTDLAGYAACAQRCVEREAEMV